MQRNGLQPINDMSANNSGQTRIYLRFICAVAIIGGLLLGYDTAVISGAEQALQDFFKSSLGDYYNSTRHGFVIGSALLGCIAGGALSGLLSSRFGRRNSLIAASVLFIISAFGSYMPEFLFRPGFQFFTPGNATKGVMWAFMAYRFTGGIGIGLVSAICPIYIAEIAPAGKRGAMVSCNQFAIIFGQLAVYFANLIIRSGLADTPELIQLAMDETGWRRMFLSELYPAVLFSLLLFLIPKSPRYLVMNGDHRHAAQILTKIHGESRAKEIITEIKSTIVRKEGGLFAYGTKVIVIGILLSVFQQAVGINAVLYYAPRLFQEMGSGTDISMTQTVIMGVVNIIFTISAATLIDRVGRKRLLVKGAAGMAVCMAVLSILAYFGVVGLTTTIFIVAYSAFFMLSWGPAYWVLISEIFPNSIRSKAVALCITVQWIVNYAVSATFPSLSDWNLGTTFLIYGIISAISGLFAMKCLPETKGMTLEEIGSIWKSDAK